MLTIRLPIAPSSNNAFFNRKNGKGRGKSAKYRAWLKDADAHYMLQKSLEHIIPIRGPYICGMIFPQTLKGDLENRSKLILDWLVSRELTSDDKFLQGLHCVRDKRIPDGQVIVQVVERGNAGSQLSGTTPHAE